MPRRGDRRLTRETHREPEAHGGSGMHNGGCVCIVSWYEFKQCSKTQGGTGTVLYRPVRYNYIIIYIGI